MARRSNIDPKRADQLLSHSLSDPGSYFSDDNEDQNGASQNPSSQVNGAGASGNDPNGLRVMGMPDLNTNVNSPQHELAQSSQIQASQGMAPQSQMNTIPSGREGLDASFNQPRRASQMIDLLVDRMLNQPSAEERALEKIKNFKPDPHTSVWRRIARGVQAGAGGGLAGMAITGAISGASQRADDVLEKKEYRQKVLRDLPLEQAADQQRDQRLRSVASIVDKQIDNERQRQNDDRVQKNRDDDNARADAALRRQETKDRDQQFQREHDEILDRYPAGEVRQRKLDALYARYGKTTRPEDVRDEATQARGKADEQMDNRAARQSEADLRRQDKYDAEDEKNRDQEYQDRVKRYDEAEAIRKSYDAVKARLLGESDRKKREGLQTELDGIRAKASTYSDLLEVGDSYVKSRTSRPVRESSPKRRSGPSKGKVAVKNPSFSVGEASKKVGSLLTL